MTSGPGSETASDAVPESAEDLFENAPCGYLSTTPQGTIVRVNATFLRWTGYGSAELVGRKRFQDLLTGGGRIYHETHYMPMLRMQGRVREIALEIVRADGQTLPAIVNAVLHTEPDGTPASIRTVVIDATERREYERELLRARRQAEESEARARALARTLQASFIPPALPEIEGLDIAAIYRPAGNGDEVGGDFYDVFETARGRHAIVIGDVCGKGVEAATVTALARYSIRASATRSARPRIVLRELNRTLLQHSAGRFVTALMATVRVNPGKPVRVRLASGGHPLAIHLRADGTVAPLGVPGMMLGVFDDAVVTESVDDLRRGEVIVLYTDGVTEARVLGGDLYGEERLAALVAARGGDDAASLVEAIVSDVVAQEHGSPRDDIAVIVVKVPA